MLDEILLAERHRLAQAQNSAKTVRALDLAWQRTINPTALDASFPAFQRLGTTLTVLAERRSSSLANDYYRQARVVAGVGLEDLPPLVGEVPDVEGIVTTLRVTGPVEVKTRVAAGEETSSAIRGAKSLLLGDIQRRVINAGRRSNLRAVSSDSAARGYARISDGGPCAFCAMLVSRGPVYVSKGSASFKAHRRCGCTAALIFEGGSFTGWTPESEHLREIWDEHRDLSSFRADLSARAKDPNSTLSQVISDKQAGIAQAA